mmetsp:Transcript_19700/g.60933  ORF Transcript_19700/g.60933 Transcript_19700/m.60933 type:complete len:811 (-) Transcript_19700:824-3256(-)
MERALAAVEAIHGRYEAASLLALKPQCRKMCTVADIVEEELARKDGDPDDEVCEGLRTLEQLVTACALCPVEAKLFQRTYVEAARKATLAVKEGLAATGDASDELEEIAHAFANVHDKLGDDIRKVLIPRRGLFFERSAASSSSTSARDEDPKFVVADKLVAAGVATNAGDALAQLRKIAESQRAVDTPPLSTEDLALLEACKRLNVDEAEASAQDDDGTAAVVETHNSRRRRVGSIKVNAQQRKPPVVPDQFRCPITLEIMAEPVFLFTQSGRSFEREALEYWLELHPTVDPLTNEEHGVLLEWAPNRVLKEVIALWCVEHEVTVEDCRSPSQPHNLSGGPHFSGTTTTTTTTATSNSTTRDALRRSSSSATSVDSWSGDLEALERELEARYPGVGAKVRRLSLSYDETMRGCAAAGLLRAMEDSETDEGEPVAQMIAEAGGIPLLVVLLAATSRAARESAAMALCRVARRPRENRAAIVNARGIVACVRLLSARDVSDLTRQAAAGVLQHVACYSMQFKVAIANAGAIPLLVGLLADADASDDTKADAARCLWSIAVNDQKKIAIANAGAIPHLVALVARRNDSSPRSSQRTMADDDDAAEDEDDQNDGGNHHIAVREAAAGALQNLAANNSDNKAAIISAGAVPPLVELLSTSDVETARETAAGALQNLAKHNESNKSVLISAGVLPPLIKTLGDDKASPRSQRTSARAIENLVWSSNEDNKRAVIDAGAVPVLCAKVLDADADAEVRQASAEALKVLATTAKLRTKVARHLGQNWQIMSPSERDVENLINSALRRQGRSYLQQTSP